MIAFKTGMKLYKKSHIDTIAVTLKRALAITFVAACFISFQNCAPSSSNSNTETPTPADEMSKMEFDIAEQNEALLKLATANLSCSDNTECTTVQVGRKGCGGPRAYYVTSKRNDLNRLQMLSAQVMNLEEEYIIKQGLVSTCESVMPPSVSCISNVCK